MFNSLFLVVAVSTVWLPHGVYSVYVFVCCYMSSACSENQCLTLSTKEVDGVLGIRLFHVIVEGSPCFRTGPSAEPFLLGSSVEDPSASLERGCCVGLGHGRSCL